MTSLRIGDLAPDFKAETTEGPISFHDWIGNSWAVLFSHPKDFTPVCTTELGQLAKLKPEFHARNVKVIGLSVDSLEDHKEWINDIERTQSCSMNYPLIADKSRKVSELYDMIHPNENETLTVRSVFIIAPDKKIKMVLTYPMATGRNFNEILRSIDSLQLTAEHNIATPAGWKQGDEVILASTVSDEEANRLFPEGFRAETPYLRYVADPRKGKKSEAA